LHDADFLGAVLVEELVHGYSPVMMNMSCVPSTNDPPSVSKANKGTTPWSFIPQKPAMMQAMRMTDKTMCEMTADGFMIIDSLRLLIGQRMKHRKSLALAVNWENGDNVPVEIIETKQMRAVV